MEANRAFVILQWLNTTKEDENRRIVQIIKLAKELQGTRQRYRSRAVDLLTWRVAGPRKPPKKERASMRRAMRLANNLRKLMTNYTFHPQLRPLRGRFYVGWQSISIVNAPFIKIRLDGDLFTICEGDVILKIVDLADKGSLHKIRVCANCSRWFFGRVKHQAYCDQRCQQSNFRMSEHFRARRREYMRKYRRDQSLRNERQARLVS